MDCREYKWHQESHRHEQNDIANYIDRSNQQTLLTNEIGKNGFEWDEIRRPIMCATEVQHQNPYTNQWNILEHHDLDQQQTIHKQQDLQNSFFHDHRN